MWAFPQAVLGQQCPLWKVYLTKRSLHSYFSILSCAHLSYAPPSLTVFLHFIGVRWESENKNNCDVLEHWYDITVLLFRLSITHIWYSSFAVVAIAARKRRSVPPGSPREHETAPCRKWSLFPMVLKKYQQQGTVSTQLQMHTRSTYIR